MRDIAHVTIEKGDEYAATLLRVQFTPMPWFFAFRQNRLEKWLGFEDEILRLEVRHAIESCAYTIRRELMRAAENQLGVKW